MHTLVSVRFDSHMKRATPHLRSGPDLLRSRLSYLAATSGWVERLPFLYPLAISVIAMGL
jgi:hypothetical protein